MDGAGFLLCCLAWGQTFNPYLHQKLLDTQRQVWLGLPLASKVTILLGLLLCPWNWGIFFFFFLLVESNILTMVVQQLVATLEFTQEKMSTWILFCHLVCWCPFHHRGLEGKSRKSRDSWNHRQIGHGVHNKVGQRLTEFFHKKAMVITNTRFSSTREDSRHGHHQMLSTKIRLIILLGVKDGEELYCQQKQDCQLILAQIMNSLIPTSDFNWRK